MKTLGEKIYDLRKANGISQEELAAEIGVARQTVSKWENNTLRPKYDKLLALCKVFDVGTDYFLSSDTAVEVPKYEIVVASSQENSGEAIELQEEEPRRNKLSGKEKLLIALLAAFAVFVAAVAVILVCLFTYAEEGIETVQSITIGLTHKGRIAVIIIAAVILITVSIILIVRLIKRNKTKMSSKSDKNVK